MVEVAYQTKKANPPRCMPLGYVFYRQFSGLPVSTLAVTRNSHVWWCLFPTACWRFLESKKNPGQKMSIVNCVATFVIIGIGLELRCTWPLLQENLRLGEWPIPSLGSQPGSDMIFVLTDAWRQSGRILPHSNKEEVHKVRTSFCAPFFVDSWIQHEKNMQEFASSPK